MQPVWERAQGVAEREAWTSVLVPLAGELEAAAAEMSAGAVEHTARRASQLFSSEADHEDNRISTEAGIRAFAGLLRSGSDPTQTQLPDATVAYARASMRRGLALALLMRSYRLSVQVAWDWIFERVAAHSGSPEQLTVASRLCAAWLFGYADTAMSQAEQLYEEERSRWARSAAAAQAETIDALLGGRPQDPVAASARLRYELDRHHVCLQAWCDDAGEADPLEALEAAVAGCARALDADAVLVQPQGLRAATAWVGRRAPFDDAKLDALRLERGTSSGVAVALSEPHPGVAGFCASHVEAGHARRVAGLAHRRAGTVTRFGRVTLTAMSTVDPDLARGFVRRELGPLAEPDDDVALRLTATLRVFLEESASRSRAAKRLGIHVNTVSYRVRQAEELLGHSIEERTLELRTALALLPVAAP